VIRLDPHRHWQRLGVLAILLSPLSLLFRLLVALRRRAYRIGLLRRRRSDCPVIVVGNITVGGSGKTPLVIWLCHWLEEQGFRPGIVSRGYGGRARHWPQQVRPDSDPSAVGDEAVVLARRCRRPVCVGPDRPDAIEALRQHTDCDIVVSDDGLQHYAMARDVEIAVVDGERRFGNGLLLPAGPLREPVSRLKSVDFVVCNGEPGPREFAMRMRQPVVQPLHGNGPAESIERFRGRRVRAIAGIGNPKRFFDMLGRFGLQVAAHPFPDHHPYGAADLQFDEELPLLMTEKDAVKCRSIVKGEAWVVSVEAQPDAPFIHRLSRAVEALAQR
jgi:tetraacyldisaccharide 4'-kinase